MDSDPQSDLTHSLGWDADSLEKSLGRLMYLATEDYRPVVQDTILHHTEGVDLIPSNMDLSSITFEILEHIGTIDVIDGRDEKWTKEINVVAWNGGKPKIDVRDWNSSHDRMSRGITLTEEQAEKMTMALVQRFRARAEHNLNKPARDDMAR